MNCSCVGVGANAVKSTSENQEGCGNHMFLHCLATLNLILHCPVLGKQGNNSKGQQSSPTGGAAKIASNRFHQNATDELKALHREASREMGIEDSDRAPAERKDVPLVAQCPSYALCVVYLQHVAFDTSVAKYQLSYIKRLSDFHRSDFILLDGMPLQVELELEAGF